MADEEEAVEVTADVEDVDDSEAVVTRSASIAEVVSEPREILEDSKFDTDFQLYDRLLEIDPELAGTVRAQAQLASGFDITHPAKEGEEEAPSDREATALQDCKQLAKELELESLMPSVFQKMIAHGNDINKLLYEDEVGVTGLQSFPNRMVTILDEDTLNSVSDMREDAPEGQNDQLIDLSYYQSDVSDLTVFNDDYYVVNEASRSEKVIPSYKIIHFAVEKDRNWFEDRFGRDTYGVWGAPRIEPIKFNLQAKHNTLTNKVAMDDSLIAREMYKINVEELFGHISNDKDRQEKAESYAADLKETLENLTPDEKPILPDEVSMEIKGAQGEAREHANFLELMNNGIMHALTFHIGSVGRDAQMMVGNQPAKDVSLNNVRHLRKIAAKKLEKIFRIHLALKHPEWRADDGDDINEIALDPEITTPRVRFDPLEEGDQERVVNQATKAFVNRVITRNEAREMIGLDPLDEDSELYDGGRDNSGPASNTEQDTEEQDSSTDSGNEENKVEAAARTPTDVDSYQEGLTGPFVDALDQMDTTVFAVSPVEGGENDD